jgi:hypothetical protein
VRRGRDHDPVEALAFDRLAESVTIGAPALDAGVDRDAERRCALLDRFL